MPVAVGTPRRSRHSSKSSNNSNSNSSHRRSSRWIRTHRCRQRWSKYSDYSDRLPEASEEVGTALLVVDDMTTGTSLHDATVETVLRLHHGIWIGQAEAMTALLVAIGGTRMSHAVTTVAVAVAVAAGEGGAPSGGMTAVGVRMIGEAQPQPLVHHGMTEEEVEVVERGELTHGTTRRRDGTDTWTGAETGTGRREI